jgi:hypothetical protein
MRRLQLVAAAAAATTAILYLLIGVGVLHIGTGADGVQGDLLGFGLAAGGAYAVIAVLLLLVCRRVIWILIPLFDAAVIAMYFAIATIRTPPLELWGLVIKAFQVLLLAAVVYLAIRGADRQPTEGRSLTPA